MKKLIHSLRATLLTLALLSTFFASAHDFEIDGIYYKKLSDKKVAVTYRGVSYSSYYNEYTGDIVIPETVTYNSVAYSVTTIGESAFSGCRALTSVTIPNSVTTIGESAFSGCRALTSVAIPNSVTSIGEDAFYGCSGLTSFTIGNSVTTIGESAFSGCGALTSVTIPNSVTSIGNYAFSGCSAIKEIKIEDGEGTLSLGYGASNSSRNGLFYDCPLEKLYLGRNLSYNTSYSDGYSPFYGKTYLTELTISSSVTTIPENLLKGCSELNSITIPNSVTSIGNYAFEGCSAIKEIKIEDGEGTLSLGYGVSNSSSKGLFHDCPIEKLYLGRDLSYNTSYGYSPFYGKTYLTELTISSSVTTIPENLLKGCSELNSITIGNSVTTIGGDAFSGCGALTSVTIPNSVTSIGNYAFSGCSAIKEIKIEDGEGTLSLGYGASNGSSKGLFYDCPLEKLYLGRNLSYNTSSAYGYSPFYGKIYLTELTISSSVTTIPENLLRGCSELNSITIPNSVTTIGVSAFSGCRALTSVAIPNSVTSIGEDAFYGCSSLTSVTIGNSVTTIGVSAFYGCSGLTSVTISNSVTTIGVSAFYGCSGLTSVTIPNSVTSIGRGAFSNCSSLTSVTIPNSVTSIGNYAFEGCSAIKEIKIEDGEGTLSLGYGASNSSSNGLFYDCPLEKLYLGRNLSYNTSYGDGYSPFYGKTYLTELTISSSVTTIPENLLRGCSELNSISIPNSVTSIGNYAFEGCSAIKEIKIEDGEGTLSLGYGASNSSRNGLFYDCPLEKLYLGRNLSYNTSPFSGKSALNNLIIGKNVSKINYDCFSNCSALKEFRTKSYNIDGLANSGLSAEKVLAIIIPDELNEEVADKISLTDLTYFNNVIIESEDKSYSLVTTPNYVEISNCALQSSTVQLLPIEKEAVAKADAKSIVNAYFRGNDILSELCDSGFKFTPTSVWKENIFDIYANSNAGGDYRHVTMKQAGSLFDELGLQDIQSLKHLKITGDINGTDIMTINRMLSLKYLDIAEANIVEGGVTYRENLKTENNVVGSDFFYNIALETLLLPETANKIDYSAFQNSPELKNVVVGKSVSSIGDRAFYNCKSLNRINIPPLVYRLDASAFSGCTSLEYLFFEDSSTILNIGSTFSSIKLKSIYWGRNISSNTPFSGNEYLHTVTFSEEVTTLEASSFSGCSGLTSVALPEKLTKIPYSLFRNCTSLQDVTIPDSVITIENDAFRNTALVEVNLPATVTSIGECSFGYTPTITKVMSLNTTPPKIQPSTFDGKVEEQAMLHVPKGALVYYWLDPVWKEFGNMADDILCLEVIPDATYGDPEIDLSHFAPEGVELIYETSNSDVIEINGTMMRIVGAGEVTVGAMLADEGSQMQLMGQMRQFKVNKADLSVTVADITIAQGQALPEFSYMVEGLVYDDTVDDIEDMPQPVCDVTEDSAPGEYAVEFTEGSDRNYKITTKTAKVTVTAGEPPVSNTDDIYADSDDEIEIFDMKGIRFYKGPRSEARLAKGFYLVRQGNTVVKVYVE